MVVIFYSDSGNYFLAFELEQLGLTLADFYSDEYTTLTRPSCHTEIYTSIRYEFMTSAVLPYQCWLKGASQFLQKLRFTTNFPHNAYHSQSIV